MKSDHIGTVVVEPVTVHGRIFAALPTFTTSLVGALEDIPGGRYRTPGQLADGALLSRCWCNRHLVHVSVAEVRAGRTVACSVRGCEP